MFTKYLQTYSGTMNQFELILLQLPRAHLGDLGYIFRLVPILRAGRYPSPLFVEGGAVGTGRKSVLELRLTTGSSFDLRIDRSHRQPWLS